VQVIRLRPGGGSACIDETLSEQDVKPGADDLDPVELVIDPTIGNGVLYVAGRGSNRVDAYAIEDDGTLPSVPTSCIVAGSGTEFEAVAPMSEGFFAAGSEFDIEVYPRVQGQFLPEPDSNAPTTPTPAPTVSPSPGPGETPGPSIPSPALTTCIDANLVSTALSSIGANIITDMFYAPSVSEPLGNLFVAEEGSERIFTFPVDANGVIDGNHNSQTNAAGIYQRMLRHPHSGAIVLYSSVFNEGRVDVFRLEDRLLPNDTFSRTAEDPNTLPVGLTIDEPSGTILYVAEGGYNRVDGFRIQPDGGLADVPVTSTAPPVDAAGQDINTFPDDVVIVPLP
jgi:hypothetical protein